MQISKFFSSNRQAEIRKEAGDARKAIENAPKGDSVEIHGDTLLVRPQGEIWQGRANAGTMTTIRAEKDSSVVLREEIVKKDNRGIQVAAAIAGTLVGAALFGGKKKDSAGAALAGLLLGGLAAWGAGKATDAVKEKRIERIETTPEGVVAERLHETPGGDDFYQSTFKRTGDPPPMDVEKVKEYIQNLPLDFSQDPK
ncbi:MAG: hypothetical protein J0I12_23400 [Candidatus Eremiobacteraeota bacterium]|nr:hypothetical protein [Candidatus Eremiobacteraeota bacterium]